MSSTRKLQHFNTYILELGWLGECMLFLLAWVVTGSACALVYRVMTHTRIHFQAAAGGGMAAGLRRGLRARGGHTAAVSGSMNRRESCVSGVGIRFFNK